MVLMQRASAEQPQKEAMPSGAMPPFTLQADLFKNPTYTDNFLRQQLSNKDCKKLAALHNERLNKFIAENIALCKPEKAIICSDAQEDRQLIRAEALKNREERRLAMRAHTLHFDSPEDQGRATKDTFLLVKKGEELPGLNCKEQSQGKEEMLSELNGIMAGRTMYVKFHVLGPVGCPVAIPAVQITDSAYVAHNANLLYRQGYEQFKLLGKDSAFFAGVHSAGELNEQGVTKNISRRKIFIDISEGVVYSANTQYAGNSLAFKKLFLRLSIKKASDELNSKKKDWLSEHMFLGCV